MCSTVIGGQIDDPGPTHPDRDPGTDGVVRCWVDFLVTRPISAFSFRTTAGELAVCLGIYRGIRASFFGGVAG